MYVENKTISHEPAGEGAVRKILAYSPNLMTVELQFEKGAIGYIVSGALIYQEEGQEDKVLTTGDTYYVAPNVVHGVKVLEDTKLLDIFTPMREDFIHK